MSLFKPDNASAQDSSYYRDIDARVFIPIYATCRVSLLKNRRVSPFVGINIGYNLDIAAGKSRDWSNYNESYSGVLVDPSVGIEIATNKRLAFFIAANCNMVITGDTGIFISGKIGVAF